MCLCRRSKGSGDVPNLLRILWENQGVKHSVIDGVFRLMPARLQNILRLGLNSFQNILRYMHTLHARQKRKFSEIEDASSQFPNPKRHTSAARGVGELAREGAAGGLQAWQNSDRFGFQQIDTDAGTHRWQTCSANDCMAR